jgi:hypothetical protein
MSGQKQDQFNLLEIQRDYFQRILEEVEGRKLLVLDQPTSLFISELVSQTELLGHEVYLVELLHKLSGSKDLDAMKTIVIVQPTALNVQAICDSLSSYYVTQCYICKKGLKRLHEPSGARFAETAGFEGC